MRSSDLERRRDPAVRRAFPRDVAVRRPAFAAHQFAPPATIRKRRIPRRHPPPAPPGIVRVPRIGFVRGTRPAPLRRRPSVSPCAAKTCVIGFTPQPGFDWQPASREKTTRSARPRPIPSDRWGISQGRRGSAIAPRHSHPHPAPESRTGRLPILFTCQRAPRATPRDIYTILPQTSEIRALY